MAFIISLQPDPIYSKSSNPHRGASLVSGGVFAFQVSLLPRIDVINKYKGFYPYLLILGVMMENPMVWSLCGKPVIIADDAHFSSKFSPNAEHRLLVQRALEQLSDTPKLTIPSKVTVDTLPWPIKAIVEPNNNRQRLWATHRKHQHMQTTNTDTASPFVFMDRDFKLPMTKSLTFEIVGTKDQPIIKDIYPGQILPPLPREQAAQSDLAVFVKSMLFWRSHSFLYDKGCVVDKLREIAPSWYTYLTPPTLLLL